MRITNAMTSNRLLLNINRNAGRLDRLYMQLSSGKIIQNPSENPIIASRALRFRTNIAEAEQHRRNTTQGMSWMEVSDQAMNNMTTILENMNTLLVQGASDTYQYEDRQKIAAELQMLFEQLHSEMNGTFAGRYLFSGFRTNHPPIITQDDPYAHFGISKGLTGRDINRGVSRAWAPPDGTPPQLVPRPAGVDSSGNALSAAPGANVIRLPYAGVDPSTIVITVGDPPVNITDIWGIEVVSLNDTSNPYEFADHNNHYHVRFIQETGELVFTNAAADRLASEGSAVLTYQINGISQGELNPIIYFNTTDFNRPLTDDDGNVIAGQFVHFTQENQELQFEFGTNVRLTVNAQARNVYTWQMFSDIQNMLDGLNRVEVSSRSDLMIHYAAPPHNLSGADLELQVDARLAYERAVYRESMRGKFSNMLGLMERHAATLTTEYTTLGSRLNRLELIYERLDENIDTFTELMSQNENVDVLEVLMRLNAAEAIMQAAMQIGARISQLSLVNFI